MQICQSCAMPLLNNEDFRTNKNKTRNREYCRHCFNGGKFLDQGITLQEKIKENIKFAIKRRESKEQAIKMSNEVLPTLKRWKK